MIQRGARTSEGAAKAGVHPLVRASNDNCMPFEPINSQYEANKLWTSGFCAALLQGQDTGPFSTPQARNAHCPWYCSKFASLLDAPSVTMKQPNCGPVVFLRLS